MLHCQSDIQNQRILLSEPSHHEKLQTGRMECHHLHIMWLLDVGFQSDTSTNDGTKKVVERVMEGDCFVEKNMFSGFWRLGWWTQMIPGHTVSRLKHKQLDRSFDQGLASMMKNCWQQLPPRCVFLCFFSLRWQLWFLRMLGVVEKMDKHPAISKKKRFNEVKWDNFPPKPTVFATEII